MAASTRKSPAVARSATVADYVVLAGRAVKRKIPADHKDHDDILSDILLTLYEKGAENWHPGQIFRYALRCAHQSEHPFEIAANDDDPIWKISSRTPAMQEIAYDASVARRLMEALPDEDRAVLEILVDGGDALDVATELKMKPKQAIQAIRRARRHAGLVDPAERA